MLRAMVVAVGLLVAAPALGQGSTQSVAPKGASAPADVDKEVKRLFEEGQAAAAVQQWDKAKTAFVTAYAHMPSLQILRHLARAEIMSGDLGAGIEHLQEFLKHKDEAETVAIDAARELLKETMAKVAAVRLIVDEPGAEVLVDGTVLEDKPFGRPIYLRAGEHTFEVRKEGYVGAPQRLELSPGAETDVSFKLVPMHNLRTEDKTAPAGPKVGAPTTRGFVTAIAIGSGALALAGAGALVWSKVERDRVESEPPCRTDVACDELRERGAKAVGFAYGSVGLFIGAGVGGVSTLIAWAVTKKSNAGIVKSRETSFTVVPTLGGVRVQGTW